MRSRARRPRRETQAQRAPARQQDEVGERPGREARRATVASGFMASAPAEVEVEQAPDRARSAAGQAGQTGQRA